MTITLNNEERKLVGLITVDGELLLPFDDHMAPTQRVALLQKKSNGYFVCLNGTGTLEEIKRYSRKPIYQGDKITIQF